MSESSPDQPKKIIIDEDWKAQVEKEREALKSADADTTSTEPPEAAADAAETGASSDEAPNQFPPATFELLVTTLATQAMVFLGQIPDPLSNDVKTDLAIAKHHIDLLAMLDQKTKGNLTDQEAQLMEAALHQLRMVYVSQSNAK